MQRHISSLLLSEAVTASVSSAGGVGYREVSAGTFCAVVLLVPSRILTRSNSYCFNCTVAPRSVKFAREGWEVEQK